MNACYVCDREINELRAFSRKRPQKEFVVCFFFSVEPTSFSTLIRLSFQADCFFFLFND